MSISVNEANVVQKREAAQLADQLDECRAAKEAYKNENEALRNEIESLRKEKDIQRREIAELKLGKVVETVEKETDHSLAHGDHKPEICVAGKKVKSALYEPLRKNADSFAAETRRN